jgi:hypothetical protein
MHQYSLRLCVEESTAEDKSVRKLVLAAMISESCGGRSILQNEDIATTESICKDEARVQDLGQNKH